MRRTGGRADGQTVTRRQALVASAGALAGLAIGGEPAAATSDRPTARPPVRLKQSVSRWPYRDIPLADFCKAAAAMGLAAIDLLNSDDWDPVRQAGLLCSMGYPTARRDFIPTGFNDRANHALLLKELEDTIPRAAQHGVPNVIAMFGNRRGKSDADAIAACVTGLNAIKALAEEQRVTICLELLNSKVDHPDYQGDRTAFGVAVVKAVGSPRVKLLYDIYHMQIMEGDIIRTIRDNREWLAHFHTGGVPGRHELDGTQELNWRAVATAIADSGFQGYLAHEFVPTREPLRSLREAVETCTV
jgi:hydroxypyruvate isomerase